MKILFKFLTISLAIMFFLTNLAWTYFGPIGKFSDSIVFVIPQEQTNFNLVDSLYDQRIIKNKNAFTFLFNNFTKTKEIKSGGYKLTQSMNAWEIIENITDKQDLMWVNVFYCPRKEQVGEKLATTLGWDQEKLNRWNNLFRDTEYYEGVFYPDTYLIPIDESVEAIAQRFVNRFNEKFEPLANEFMSKNIKWTTGIKIASLVAREAAGREDARLISGIIWNRLNQDMRLQIDATMQYTLGKNENGSWWGNISLEQKQSDSPYNSYKNEGLPPTPICSPNVDFIEVALNPEETDCIFYLHDQNRQIHCAKTYKEHKENIRLYL
ncbi:MAG: hypothetical protein ACD_19C00428G0001 [uncultured bacterium]|nr:MAG: hypothetical protein ACD_19C00428G0001 [uncultured bacterium]